MVLGLRSKNRRGTSVQVDYIIHIEEIKPWPPSQSLKSLRSVVLQWENGDRSTGSTSPVTPSIGQGKIEFNESFKLQVTLLKESSGKGSDFQKNVLELNLYEPRRDKTVKGQLLGSAVVDLAEHGIVKEITSFAVPVNCKRSFRNTAQPVLYVRIQPLDREGSSSSSRESLSKEASLDKDGRESVSALMSEEYAEEAEFASFTDDDVSSHSSLTNSPGEQAPHESTSEALDGNTGEQNLETDIPPKPMPAEVDLKPVTSASALSVDSIHQNGSLPLPLLADLSIDSENLNNGDVPVSKAPQMSSTLVLDKPDTPSTHSSPSLVSYAGIEETRHSNFSEGFEKIDLNQEAKEKMADCRSEENVVDNPLEEENNMNALLDRKSSNLYQEELNSASTADPEQNVGDKFSLKTRDGSNKVVSVVEESVEEVQHHSMEMECPSDSPPNKTSIASVAESEYTLLTLQHRYLENALRKPASPDTIMSAQKVLNEGSTRILTNDRLKNMRLSMRSSLDSLGSIRRTTSDQYREDVKEIDVLEDIHKGGAKLVTNGADEQELTSLISENVKHVSRFNRNSFSNNKVRELELRVEMLEGELREAAAIEIGLYSIIAEHGSSAHKVHTPARRLSRLYLHALKEWSQERKAGAARSIVSGLVLVAKACGNDVPRLTYWLSNSVVLRAIVTQAIGQSDPPKSAVPHNRANGSGMMATGKSSPLKWESAYHKKEKFSEENEDWEDPCTFVAALDKTEAWIFSRIIESVWWETLTPRMQSAIQGSEQSTGSCLKKKYGRKPSVGDQQQATLSIETWKNAFKDACERLCPVRAGGHECGCLPMLARLVMEQCVARLDVAMFNTILRESDDEIPTDPVSDPVSDPKVLPIPPGKSSFGAGAQLKNAIGNWSRWLTDLFGMDVDDSPQDEKDQDDDRLDVAASFKSFHLLNALSDLLMLPKDMLLETSIRKEVCPTFSASMIKRILSSFLPDEFCPDPIPEDLLEALDSEDPLESGNEGIRNFPCNASPVIYSPPSVTSIEIIFGDVRSAFALGRSRSSVVRKGHTSDDELDELDSPLSSIVIEKSSTPTPRWMGNRNANAVRYQLLRDVWRNDD